VSQWRAGQEGEEKEDEEGLLGKVLSSAPTRRLVLPVAWRDLRIILLLLMILLEGGAKNERSSPDTVELFMSAPARSFCLSFYAGDARSGEVSEEETQL
jgi:hypothetical protein